jgi:hypothetical protein
VIILWICGRGLQYRPASGFVAHVRSGRHRAPCRCSWQTGYRGDEARADSTRTWSLEKDHRAAKHRARAKRLRRRRAPPGVTLHHLNGGEAPLAGRAGQIFPTTPFPDRRRQFFAPNRPEFSGAKRL